jgi:branched-chain amino acid transport system ATP-binding protein
MSGTVSLPAGSAFAPPIAASTRQAAATLEAKDIGKHFGGIHALEGVSLQLRAGEVHGLIGPNGSGKTTLLNLISGYYPIDDGGIHLGGMDVTRQSVQDRARWGLARTFQTP